MGARRDFPVAKRRGIASRDWPAFGPGDEHDQPELRRNAVGRGGYQPVAAERLALRRRHALRASKIMRLSQLTR